MMNVYQYPDKIEAISSIFDLDLVEVIELTDVLFLVNGKYYTCFKFSELENIVDDENIYDILKVNIGCFEYIDWDKYFSYDLDFNLKKILLNGTMYYVK